MVIEKSFLEGEVQWHPRGFFSRTEHSHVEQVPLASSPRGEKYAAAG